VWRRLTFKYALIQLLLTLVAQLLFYIVKKENITINQNEKENLTRRERLRKYLRKILPTRGGQLPTSTIFEIANVILENRPLFGYIILALKSMRLQELQVSIYDLYMGTSTLKGESDDGCRSIDSLFGYLFTILQDDKASFSSEEQTEKIYSEVFDNDNLKQTSKNKKYIALFLACTIFFLKHFKESGLGTTYNAFFKALIKAVKTGKISKALARSLVNRLNRAELHVPQELIKLIHS